MMLSESSSTTITELVVSTDFPIRRTDEPLTIGVPLPRGLARDTAQLSIASAGTSLPLQATVLERWPDGSLRWVLVDTQLSTAAARTTVELRSVPAPARELSKGLASAAGDGRIRIDTGAASFLVGREAPGLFEEVSARGTVLLSNSAGSRVSAHGTDGNLLEASWTAIDVESPGPLRATLRAHGTFAGAGGAVMEAMVRLHFFAGSGAVKIALTVRNPNRAEHQGGYWELGDPGSILLKSLDWRFTLDESHAGSAIVCSRQPGDAPVSASRSLALQQHGSGGENWRSSIHVDRSGQVPIAAQGYRLALDGAESDGLRATPVVGILGETTIHLAASIPQFWENFPRGITATPSELQVELFPAFAGAPHELQGGEQKTHEFVVLFGEDTITDVPLDWCRCPLRPSAAPEWYARAEAVPYLAAKTADGDPYEALVDAALDGADTFRTKRERIDQYGWRHFGDIYGDHEAVFAKGPLVSHYNNQYDPIAGLTIQFMRSGDARWWREASDLAAHVRDVDIYHTTRDKSAYNGGLFWHTVHYVDAGRSTHRIYPRAAGSSGGGPSCEHNYVTGFLLQYYMTGDPSYRDAAVGLARFVLDIDDGSRTVFRWLAQGDTGLASASRTPDYHGPGRGSGNSLSALVDGHRLTGDRVFLDKAEQIIRRCTHPDQDVGRLDLLDAENRWFYTMYLQALGKYLDYKIERGELDEMYAYGRAVLVHFAEWMADHEYPYLTKPERLEYPTETWAAQDMRKSEVFFWAARHAPEPLRARLLERARFFHDYSTNALMNMPTRTLARPVVLLLSFGCRARWFGAHGVPTAPAPAVQPASFPKAAPFVPQKTVAMQRAKLLVALGGAAGVAGALFALSRWLL